MEESQEWESEYSWCALYGLGWWAWRRSRGGIGGSGSGGGSGSQWRW